MIIIHFVFWLNYIVEYLSFDMKLGMGQQELPSLMVSYLK